MSKVALEGNASGTGTFTIASPNSNNSRTVTLPDNTGTIITTGSTAGVTPAMLSQPFTSGTAVASTSGTSIDFTGIPSWVKRITVMLSAVSTSGTSNLLIQSGSGSIATSGYVSASVVVNAVSGNSTTGITSTAGFIAYSASASNSTSGFFTLVNVSGNVWVSSNNLYLAAGNVFCESGAGTVTLGGTLDRVRITTVNGTDTFDAGSINILYE